MKHIHIVNYAHKLAIDLPESKLFNGNIIQGWHMNYDKNQTWIFNEGYILSALDTDYCLDVKDDNFVNGSLIQLWKLHGGLNQKWIFENGLIKSFKNPNFCIDIGGKIDGSKIQLWHCVGNENQKWTLALTNNEKIKIENEKVKTEAKQKILNTHVFKSSNGQVFCKFCGIEPHKTGVCKRENGHNYILMKNRHGGLRITCNKCLRPSWESEIKCH